MTLIQVFARGQSTRSCPLESIPRESALDLVSLGFARWVSDKRKSIQMTREPASLKVRDLSASMGPKVSQAAIEGSERHKHLVQAWAGHKAG